MQAERAEKDHKITSSYIKAILRLHFSPPKFAVVEEVRNATGKVRRSAGARARYADMLAIGLWPSSGLDVIGFEIKTTRSDWLKEIGDDKKSVAVQKYCDRWNLVVPHRNHDRIVRMDEHELPPTWGMFTVDEEGVLRELVKAPKLSPESITREFLASLMRNACASNPDYIEVQSRVMEARCGTSGKSTVRTLRRVGSSVQAAEIKRLKRVIADMEASATLTRCA